MVSSFVLSGGRSRRGNRSLRERSNRRATFAARCTIDATRAKRHWHANERHVAVARNRATGVDEHALGNGFDEGLWPDDGTIGFFKDHAQGFFLAVGRASHDTATNRFGFKAAASSLFVAGNAARETQIQTGDGAQAGTARSDIRCGD